MKPSLAVVTRSVLNGSNPSAIRRVPARLVKEARFSPDWPRITNLDAP
jgi:hypothetical protein